MSRTCPQPPGASPVSTSWKSAGSEGASRWLAAHSSSSSRRLSSITSRHQLRLAALQPVNFSHALRSGTPHGEPMLSESKGAYDRHFPNHAITFSIDFAWSLAGPCMRWRKIARSGSSFATPSASPQRLQDPHQVLGSCIPEGLYGSSCFKTQYCMKQQA